MVKWGIIGCGNVCEVKSGPGFYRCENSSLVAVMRRNEEKAKEFAERHGVPTYYSNADDLINDPEVDAVYIATPPESHAELAIQVLNAGKPVYVEKPMACTYQECLQMIEAARQNKQKLFVAYYRRALPYFLKVKELIDKKIIGQIQTVKVDFFHTPYASDLSPATQTWRLNKQLAGGGYFYDTASHTIDILLFLLGKIVRANGITGNTGGLYAIEDTVSASFLFESGIIGSGLWSYVSPAEQAQDRITIVGEKGVIECSTFAFTDIQVKIQGNMLIFNYPRPQHIQMHLIQEIVNELEQGKSLSPSTGETAAWTNWVMEQIYKKN